MLEHTRQIKYRIWDEDNQSLYFPDKAREENIWLSPNGIPVINPNDDEVNTERIFVVDLFTGIRNAVNTEDIYENDIVSFSLIDEDNSFVKGFIAWNEIKCGFYVYDDNEKEWELNRRIGYTILGNKHGDEAH